MARTRRVTPLKRRSRKVARTNKSHKKHGGSFWNRTADPVYGPRNSRLATFKNSMTDSLNWVKNSAKSGFQNMLKKGLSVRQYGLIGSIKKDINEKITALENARREKRNIAYANRSYRRSRRSRRRH